jgi:class 3 adenylate cyclase/tetratricopeptide (TPR) repeat protein
MVAENPMACPLRTCRRLDASQRRGLPTESACALRQRPTAWLSSGVLAELVVALDHLVLRDGMWAVLFTDLVGSTAQRARLGDEAGDALRREHDVLVRRALAGHRGEFVNDTGDGAMCVFASAADAIAGGVAIQQSIDRRNRDADEPINLRVGVSTGELVVEGPGLMGLAAHEAARICALGEGGEVLVSDLARLMAGTRTDAELVERGSFELKGIPDPVTVWEVVWEPEDAPRLPVTSRLVVPDAWRFVGRTPELTVLRDLWAQALSGARQGVLIAGEPGIGKTRLAAEIAEVASGGGALVLYGQCDDEVGPPYQPFIEALEWYLEVVPDVVGGRYPGDLARLSPQLRQRVQNIPDALAADPETEQRRLFDAVVSWLVDLSAQQPVLLVLDDLHWATRATLILLRHVLRNTAGERMLVIGTYRDSDLDGVHPLASMLVDFRRIPGVDRIEVTGLDEAGVVEFLVAASGQEADDRLRDLARVLLAETEGNPFFVGEVLRHLVETGAIVRSDGRWTTDRQVAELGIPEGVREVVGQRLGRLSESANALLATGAVIGREFTVPLLAEVGQRDPEEILSELEAASRAGIVEEVGVDRFRFAHALVRTTLHDEISSSRRLRLHRRIGEALERIQPDDVAALAYHWLEADAAGDTARAVAHATQAATRATDIGAYDDAIRLYRRALELTNEAGPGDVRSDLLLSLGDAQGLAGDIETKSTLRQAIASAGRAGDILRVARGAARLCMMFSLSVDEDDVATMLDALDQIEYDSPRDRAHLLMAAAGVIMHLPFERRAAFADEALAIARELGDPELLVRVGANYLHVLAIPENLEQRLALAHEMEALAPQLHNAVARWWALPVQPAWEAGLLDEVERNDSDAEAISADVPFLFGRVVVLEHRVKRALFDGDLASAEQWAEEADTVGAGVLEWYYIGVAQRAMIRCDQGRADEILEEAQALADVAAGTGLEPLARSFLARVLFESGDVVAASRLLAAEADTEFEAAQRDGNWYPYQAHWAELAAEMNQRDAALALHASLVPYTDRIANFAPVALGSVARLVGRLETTLGRYDDAATHLTAAAARHEALGAMLWLARTWADQAELLFRQEGLESAQARELLDQATTSARDRGARGVQRYVKRVVERVAAGPG